MPGIAPKLPLNLDPSDLHVYKATKTLKATISQNLKMLVLTSPGERIMMPEYGVGIRNFLFSNDSYQTRQEISSKIREQTSIYMPFVNLVGVDVRAVPDDAVASSGASMGLFVLIKYTAPGISGADILELSF